MKLTTKIRKISIWLALGTLLPAIMFSACDHSYLDGIDDMEDYNYTPTFALPLVNSSISMDDLFDLGELDEFDIDEENLITMVYKGQIFSIDAADLFQVENQAQEMSFDSIIPSGSGTITLPPRVFLITFDNNEILSYISFLEGFFRVSAEAELMQQDGYNISATYTILNSLDSNGQPITGSVSLDNPGETDLAGSSITFDNEANFFQVEYQLTISGNGNPDNAPYSVKFNNSMTNIQYDLIKGYVDQISFPVGNTSIGLSIFKKASEGNILFENPTIDFAIANSFGTEIDLSVEEFYATTIEEDTIPIDGPAFDQPWRIGAHPMPEDGVKTTYQVLNNSNSNLFQITAQSPKKLYYKVNGLTNPDGNTETTNWVKHDSNLAIDMEVKLPMWGQINYFELKDTTDLPLNQLPDELDWAELKLTISNGFPLGISMKVILLDENNLHLDTLFNDQPQILQAAPVDPVTNIVTEPVTTSTLEMVDQNKIGSLTQASKMIIEAKLSSYDHENGTAVKILDNYRIGVEMGLRAKAKVVVEF